jgi:hypothetical protein
LSTAARHQLLPVGWEPLSTAAIRCLPTREHSRLVDVAVRLLATKAVRLLTMSLLPLRHAEPLTVSATPVLMLRKARLLVPAKLLPPTAAHLLVREAHL